MTCTLLTGGFGYIGSHTATILAEKNQKFFIIDNFINCKKDVVDKLERITKQKVHFCKVDVRDTESLIKIIKENNVSSVIHFAALKKNHWNITK
jgi:UDP-glucose 4-epimerase